MPVKISIHALLAESDGFNPFKTLIILTFLSTLSLRRATSFINRRGDNNINFYPRSPCGERLICGAMLPGWVIFLSTLSLRRATSLRLAQSVPALGISIHALLAESDARNISLLDIS